MTIKRIGFACKWIDHPEQVSGIKPTDSCKQYNCKTTTVAWLNRQTKEVAEQRLWEIMVHNIQAALSLVEKVGQLEKNLRMVRLGSDILPVYTESSWSYFYRRPDVVDYCERNFQHVGDAARRLDVRLSFHPGQFCVLASDNPDTVDRSVEEFEYHADMARWMGYGKTFQDFKINVHISGRAGAQGVRSAYRRLTPEARNCITIENEEITHGIQDCLSISDIVPIVLDIHHHWVREGTYIQPDDEAIGRIIGSWRGVRPVCHYSVSREDELIAHCLNTLPDMPSLLASGHNKQKLRAHSDFFWNNTANTWALSFWDNFDIMCESKAKNLASMKLYEHANSI